MTDTNHTEELADIVLVGLLRGYNTPQEIIRKSQLQSILNTMTDTKHTDSVESIVQEANKRLSNMEHAVLEAGEADAFLNWLRTTLQATQQQQVEEAVRKIQERCAVEVWLTWQEEVAHPLEDTPTTRALSKATNRIRILTPNHQD